MESATGVRSSTRVAAPPGREWRPAPAHGRGSGRAGAGGHATPRAERPGRSSRGRGLNSRRGPPPPDDQIDDPDDDQSDDRVVEVVEVVPPLVPAVTDLAPDDGQ